MSRKRGIFVAISENDIELVIKGCKKLLQTLNHGTKDINGLLYDQKYKGFRVYFNSSSIVNEFLKKKCLPLSDIAATIHSLTTILIARNATASVEEKFKTNLKAQLQRLELGPIISIDFSPVFKYFLIELDIPEICDMPLFKAAGLPDSMKLVLTNQSTAFEVEVSFFCSLCKSIHHCRQCCSTIIDLIDISDEDSEEIASCPKCSPSCEIRGLFQNNVSLSNDCKTTAKKRRLDIAPGNSDKKTAHLTHKELQMEGKEFKTDGKKHQMKRKEFKTEGKELQIEGKEFKSKGKELKTEGELQTETEELITQELLEAVSKSENSTKHSSERSDNKVTAKKYRVAQSTDHIHLGPHVVIDDIMQSKLQSVIGKERSSRNYISAKKYGVESQLNKSACSNQSSPNNNHNLPVDLDLVLEDTMVASSICMTDKDCPRTEYHSATDYIEALLLSEPGCSNQSYNSENGNSTNTNFPERVEQQTGTNRSHSQELQANGGPQNETDSDDSDLSSETLCRKKSVFVPVKLPDRIVQIVQSKDLKAGELNVQQLEAFLTHAKKNLYPSEIAEEYTDDVRILQQQLIWIKKEYYSKAIPATREDKGFIKYLKGLLNRFNSKPKKRRD